MIFLRKCVKSAFLCVKWPILLKISNARPVLSK